MPTQAEETIAGCLVEAQSSDSSNEVQSKALQILASLTRVSSTNRNILAHTDEAISVILALSESEESLSSSSPPIQTLALSVLFNLSLNPSLKLSLARMDVVHHLNSVVLSPSSSLSGKLAASLICSLAMMDKNKAKFGVAGTVQAVIEALGTTTSAESSGAHHLLSSLAELVQFHGNCTLAVRLGAVPMLVRVLEGPLEDLAGPSLSILGLLARFEEGIGAIRAVEGVVGLLVDGLKRGCMVSRESSAEILTRLFEESEEYAREAVGKPEFATLLADLSIRGSTKARDKAGVLMRKMMEANLDCYVKGNPIVLIR